MRKIDEVYEELAWSEPDMCQNCIWFCPWNGQGWGCSHETVFDLLEGECKCEGRHFKQRRPWKIDGTIVSP